MRSQIGRFNKSSRALKLGQSLAGHMPALTDAEDFPDNDSLVGSGQPIKVQTAFPVAITLQKVSLAPLARSVPGKTVRELDPTTSRVWSAD